MKKIYIASDHAGFLLKAHFIKKNTRFPWEDLGVFTDKKSVDYPDYVEKLALSLSQSINQNKKRKKVENTKNTNDPDVFGVLICKSGQGMAMKANRYFFIRAALCWSEDSARLSREHNNANVLCLGGGLLEFSLCEKILKTFLESKFLSGRHEKRIEKLVLNLNLEKSKE